MSRLEACAVCKEKRCPNHARVSLKGEKRTQEPLLRCLYGRPAALGEGGQQEWVRGHDGRTLGWETSRAASRDFSVAPCQCCGAPSWQRWGYVLLIPGTTGPEQPWQVRVGESKPLALACIEGRDLQVDACLSRLRACLGFGF